MPGAVLNPGSGSSGSTRVLGVDKFVAAGAYIAVPPAGARFYRLSASGGGGAGGAQVGRGDTVTGGGGGQGALQRRWIALRSSTIPIQVGAGGARTPAGDFNGQDGGDTLVAGFVAAGGKGGKSSSSANGGVGGAGGAGADGPMITGPGFGSYSGNAGSSPVGGGKATPSAAQLGQGGDGGVINANPQAGSAGADGYVYLEYYG